MKVYKTNNIEDSIRKLYETGQTVVFEYYQCKRKIRLRKNLLKDIPSLMVRSWMNIAQSTIDNWDDKLLFYYHHASFNKLPSTENMLIVECPLQYKYFEKYASKATEELVIYVPPTWEMQEETIADRFPTMEDISIAIKWFSGKPALSVESKLGQLSLEASGYDPTTVCCFTGKEWEDEVGMPEKRLRNILHGKYRRKYKRMTPFRLVSRPDNPFLSNVYDELDKETKYNGMVILRDRNLARVYEKGRLQNRIPKYENALKQMIKEKNIIQYPAYYIVLDKRRLDFKWNRIIKTEEAYWNDWYKMRDFVNNLPEY